ncbi:MAG: putative RNA uridine N3 methyltransferase, partial [Candidatus Thermoplasmatota archaeon]|nr:putative RNA uridine N3 methyltransferase [Candidatus Thermoplasmatota archaeon]
MAGVRSLIVPGSLTAESADPRIATYKVGMVGRAAAIFSVDEIIVYEDPAHKDARTVKRILQYQGTAPYLRKRLFPISEELTHVGVLPPLNLPLHLVDRRPEVGDVRFGAMVGNQVDIGLPRMADLKVAHEDDVPEPGDQFPVKVEAVRGANIVVSPYIAEPDEYLGYVVNRAPSIRTALRDQQPILGTSRDGEPFSKDHLQPEGVALLFGSTEESIEELLGEEPRFPRVNTIPDQA